MTTKVCCRGGIFPTATGLLPSWVCSRHDLVEMEQLLFCAGAAERRRGAVCGHHRFG